MLIIFLSVYEVSKKLCGLEALLEPESESKLLNFEAYQNLCILNYLRGNLEIRVSVYPRNSRYDAVFRYGLTQGFC